MLKEDGMEFVCETCGGPIFCSDTEEDGPRPYCPKCYTFGDDVTIVIRATESCPEGKAILYPSDVLDENTGEIIPEKVAVINLE